VGRLRSTSFRGVDLPGKGLLFRPLSFEHIFSRLPRGIELSFSLSFYNSLQRLGVRTLPLGRQILGRRFQLFGRAVLDEMPTHAAFFTDITWWGMTETSYAQSYSRAVLDVVAGDAAPPTNVVARRDPSSFLARHGTHLGRCQSSSIGVSWIIIWIDPQSI
jgi:hypothetical protein